MKGQWIEGLAEMAALGLRLSGPHGDLQTETKAESIIISIGIAAGLGAIAYGLVATKYNAVTKAKPSRS